MIVFGVLNYAIAPTNMAYNYFESFCHQNSDGSSFRICKCDIKLDLRLVDLDICSLEDKTCYSNW